MSDVPHVKPQAKLLVWDRPCTVVRLASVDEALVAFDDDGTRATVPIPAIRNRDADKKKTPRALDAVHEEDYAQAKRRYRIIKPILDAPFGMRKKMIAAARAEHGVSRTTIFRWLEAFNACEVITDLAPNRRKPHKSRVPKDVEDILADAITKDYLKLQRKSVTKLYEKIVLYCRTAGLKPPHINTVRKRVKGIKAYEVARRRYGEKAARDKFSPVTGKYPGAVAPLAVVQIDHTLLDIILVDDRRETIGRPWVTVVIDVFSRMVMGFHLSLEPPSIASVGLALKHGMLPKEDFLARLGVDAKWPVSGIPRKVLADNAKEFRARDIVKTCGEYGITIEWRKVATPHYGGHIERVLGTLNREIHAVKGTTFSDVKARAGYDSEAHAVMTFEELERYLTVAIAQKYHYTQHRELKITPLERWSEGILGTEGMPGSGLPRPVRDPERFEIDFLPSATRTIQRDGISFNNTLYFHEVLRPFIETRGHAQREFLLRYDPRDMSRIHLLDPKEGRYIVVPMRDLFKPSVAKWEIDRAKKRLREKGYASRAMTEDMLFAAVAELNRIEDESDKATKKVRRDRQRRRNIERARKRTPRPAANDDGGNADAAVARTTADTPTKVRRKTAEVEDFDFTEDDLKPKWEKW